MQNFKISIGALEWAEISRPAAISRYCTSCRLLDGGFAACQQSAEASFRCMFACIREALLGCRFNPLMPLQRSAQGRCDGIRALAARAA
jgi:hypothetical protein